MRYKKSGLPDYNVFKSLRTQLKSEINQAYSSYISTINNNIKGNPKPFWSFQNLKRNSGSIPSVMTYNDDSLNNAQQVADGFSDY
jgi:hypothetical protein